MPKAEKNVLQKRNNRYLDMSQAIWDDENMEARINLLGKLHDEGEDYDSDCEYDTSVNEVFPRTRMKTAALYGRRPDFVVRPTDAAKNYGTNPLSAKALLMYISRKRRHIHELRNYLRDGALLPYGCVMLGMESEGKKPWLPFVQWQDARSVRTDPTLEKFRPQEDRWEFRKVRRSIARMRTSGLYKKSDLDAACDKFSSRFGDAFEEETCILWLGENYTIDSVEGKEKTIVSTAIMGASASEGPEDQETNGENESVSAMLGEDDRLWIRDEQFSDVLRMPLRFLDFVPSVNKYFPRSLVEMWLPQLYELNLFRRQKLVEAYRGTRRFWISEEVAEKERQKMELHEPLVGIVIPAGRDGKAMVGAVDLGTIPAESFQGEADASQSIQKIDGSGTAQMGSEPERGSVSATRDAFIEQNFRLRQSEMQEIWEENTQGIYHDVLNVAQAEMSGELMQQIVGLDGAVATVPMSRKAIAGDYDIELVTGSMLPRDREKEKEEAGQDWQLFSARPDIVNSQALARSVMERRDIRNIDELLDVQPQPQQATGAQGVPEQDTGIAKRVMQEMSKEQGDQPANPNAVPGFGGS